MIVRQVLNSGIEVRQDITVSTRFVMFKTRTEGWEGFASNVGAATIVNYQNNIFGITAKHVLKDFTWRELAITNEKFGNMVAGLSAIYYPSSPRESAAETDITDIAIIKFSEDCGSDFFKGSAYVLDPNTMGSSKDGDRILVQGFLKSKTEITEEQIKPVPLSLELNDSGAHKTDPILRVATGQLGQTEFDEITGISGGPVFNITRGFLSGMAVRGGLNKGDCNLLYIDIFDIEKVLSAICSGKNDAHYKKQMPKKVD